MVVPSGAGRVHAAAPERISGRTLRLDPGGSGVYGSPGIEEKEWL